jgi:two-component system, NtrC family, response regulator GlrR
MEQKIEETSVLVVDFNPVSGLSGEIASILARVKPLRMTVSQVSAEWQNFDPQQLIPNMSRDTALFVVIPHALLKQSDALQSILTRISDNRPLMAVTDVDDSEQLLALLQMGVDDCITPPLRESDLTLRLCRLLRHKDQSLTLTRKFKKRLYLEQMIGECQEFRRVIDKIPLVAGCDASVLISGETGTGKEICARAIHYLSPRQHYPFVPLNCGAIPVELVENELFGHASGAFTGASYQKHGLLHEAEGGTLFLDEIDSLPLTAQVKLLRVLQEKEYRPLGSTKARTANMRVVAATNIDADEAIRTGRLRQDLYYRLNVIRLHMPPLRERRHDIPALSSHFLEKYALEVSKSGLSLSADALQLLQDYDWPGNVRQLENLIARAVVLAERNVIEGKDLDLPASDRRASPGNFRVAKSACIAQFERDYVENLLHLHQGNITKAAKAAEKNRRAFWEMIRKYRIDVRQFKRNLSAK